MKSTRFAVFVVLAVALCTAGAAVAQTVISSEVRQGTVIGKTDHSVIMKGVGGEVREYEVAPGQTAMVDGKPVGLADLKIGTVLTATFQTIAKPVEVKTTTIKDGEVVKVAGSQLTTREKDGFHVYTVPKGFRFNVEGVGERSVDELSPGMKLNATIVTTSSKMTTETKRGKVGGSAPAEPTPVPVAAAPAPAPTAVAEAAPPPPPAKKKLPKTAGPLPLLALLGASSLAAGLGLRASRRSR